jgi:arginase
MGTVSGVSAHFRKKDQHIGLIWFDAHGDMNIPGMSPSGNIHGMPLAHLLGDGDSDLNSIGGFVGKVRPENVALVGIRDVDSAERKIIQASGINTYTMRDIDEKGMANVANEIIEVVSDGTAGFHVSFDVDGCDPSVIPGSGTLVQGGINFREAHLLLEYCADTNNLLSMEVVELNPFLDQGNVSAERTVQMILSAFGKRIL